MSVQPALNAVLRRIVARSRSPREAYLSRMAAQRAQPGTARSQRSCTNLAHACAAMPPPDKILLKAEKVPNLAIVTSYNDVLSAHQPYEHYPSLLRAAALKKGATAQVAGGVAAMCDGITQGQAGMELSLFSRDVIALSTAVALSHQVFDAGLYLGICDKIIPGLLIAALRFGHLPALFVPAGPMTTGISNLEKAKKRQLYAEGKLSRDALLETEMGSYHAAGTCTFYGTANSNQMLMEIMGLHLPSAAFVNPHNPLREALTREAAYRAVHMATYGPSLAEVLDERSIVNGIVGLLATGGSSNHTIHLVAIARAAGIRINWDDFNDLSGIVPLLARIYPNGAADVNQFQAAGGMAFIIRELIDAGLLFSEVKTVFGDSLARYTEEPWLNQEKPDPDKLDWRPGTLKSLDENIIRPAKAPFSADGGLRLLTGNLGRAIIKISAVAVAHRRVRAPARVFNDQNELIGAFKAGKLDQDFVAVIRFQGPHANGMPELHKLTPTLSVLQDRGFAVALVTDGRMSGASGKVPAAIHLTPESLNAGPLAKVQDDDMICLDAEAGTLMAEVDEAVWQARPHAVSDLSASQFGVGRELFTQFRQAVTAAEEGAMTFGFSD